jgi:predicted DNA binding protein
MSVVAEFAFPVESLPLGQGLGTETGLRVELERIVPVDGAIVPYVWVWGESPEGFADVTSDVPGVETVELVDRVPGGALYRVRWRGDDGSVLRGVAEAGLIVLESEGTADGWRLRVRGDDRGAVAAFGEYCEAHGCGGRLLTLVTLQSSEADRYGLTATQAETLGLAYDRGYFDDPRRTSLAELGVELGVSRQAVAARLRRAHRNLIAATLRRE